GVQPDAEASRVLTAVAAFINFRSQRRAVLISGTLANHARKVGHEWVVSFAGQWIPVTIKDDASRTVVSFEDGETLAVTSDWLPGRTHAHFLVNGRRIGVKAQAVNSAFRLRWRGIDEKVHVRTPRVAELARLMPVKLPPDTSKMLLCPMPGVITSIAVKEGDEVQEGQALATVEA